MSTPKYSDDDPEGHDRAPETSGAQRRVRQAAARSLRCDHLDPRLDPRRDLGAEPADRRPRRLTISPSAVM